VKHIVAKAYRVPQAPKNDVRNAEQTSFREQKKPRPLAEGGGEGSQHLYEGFRAQAKPKIASSKEKFFSREPRAAASPSKLLC
jgi:hypothetical protein